MHVRIKREIERWRCVRHTLVRVIPADKTTDSRPSQGAPSPSPPHPHPSQVPPAAQVGGGGVQTCIWDAGSGKQKRTLVDQSRRVGSFPMDGRWGTDDGRDQTLGGPDEYTEMGGKGEYSKKRERRQARYSCRSKYPG